MAITINQQPPEIIAAYSDITLSVQSNMVVSKYKFKYVYDIFCTTSYPSGTYQYLGRVKQTPNPAGYGILDLSRYLQLQMSGNTFNNEAHNLTLPTLQKDQFTNWNLNGFQQYYVMCGEEYSNTLYGTVSLYNGDGTICSGTTLAGIQTIISSTYNGVNQFEDGYNPNMTEYFITSGRTLATNAPRTQYREQDENITFGGFLGNYSGITVGGNSGFYPDMNYKIYNSSGTLLSSGTTFQFFGGSGSGSKFMWYGSMNLNQIVSGYTNTWNKVVIDFGTKNVTYPGYTESMTYINKGCPWDKYDPKDVIFLNRFGIWETFRFYGSKDEEIKISRGTYQRSYGTWSSAAFGYNTFERGTTNLKTDLNVQGEVQSDFLDRETVNYLGELLTSPSVFFIENNKMVPINITDSGFKYQLRGNRKLRQVVFKYEKSNQLRTQQQS